MFPLQSALTPVYLASGYSAYLGATTITLCPRAASAAGSAPHTSPSPPVFDHGATSEETNTTSWSLVGLPLEAPRPRLMTGRAAAAAEAVAATTVEVVGRRVAAARSLAVAAAAAVEAEEAAEVEMADDEDEDDDEGCAAANEGPLTRKQGRAGMGVSCGGGGGKRRRVRERGREILRAKRAREGKKKALREKAIFDAPLVRSSLSAAPAASIAHVVRCECSKRSRRVRKTG